jgi:hypothetical protein
MTPLNAATTNAQPGSEPVSRSAPKPRRTVRQILLSYFYWTYSRGSFHYDVMVTLILLFIFLSPQIPGVSYGDKPSATVGPVHPIEVVSNNIHGLVVTVQAEDVSVPAGASDRAVKQILRKAIEPVTGDNVYVDRWQTVVEAQGKLAWRIWAHR